MSQPLCVIDCAIKEPCYDSFNRLVERYQYPFLYHAPSFQGMGPLYNYPEAKGYLIFGSASSVNDRLPWQIELAQFAKSKLEKGIPIMGICFGHQLMADSFGGTVNFCDPNKDANDEKNTFLGNREIEVFKDGFIFKKGEKFTVFKAHSEEVKIIGEDLIHIGKSSECLHEILIHKTHPYFGLQGHPEGYGNFINQEFVEVLSESEIQKSIADGEKLIDKFFSYVISN